MAVNGPRNAKVSKGVSSSVYERILAGAGDAFGSLGYAATRVEDILAASGVSRPTFYKAFKGKDDVFEALSEHHHRTILDRMRGVLTGGTDPLDRFTRAMETFFRWRIELGPVGRVLDAEGRSPLTRLRVHRERAIETLTAALTAALAQDGLPAPDPLLVPAMLAATETLADSLLEESDTEAALRRRIEFARRFYSTLFS